MTAPLKVDRGQEINQGLVETKNLSECLKVDFADLYRCIFPNVGNKIEQKVRDLQELGILKRMDAMATLLVAEHGSEVLSIIEEHKSDTARGWAAFIAGNLPGKTLLARFNSVKKFADDAHFGVREWAWMAVRRYIANEPEQAIAALADWTGDKSPRVRRFACEATQPRGVWAEHIQRLKENPEFGLPILVPLNEDPERYVQDSVANWLNDAAKSQPKWVKMICATWIKRSDSKTTAYITKRAQRSIK